MSKSSVNASQRVGEGLLRACFDDIWPVEGLWRVRLRAVVGSVDGCGGSTGSRLCHFSGLCQTDKYRQSTGWHNGTIGWNDGTIRWHNYQRFIPMAQNPNKNKGIRDDGQRDRLCHFSGLCHTGDYQHSTGWHNGTIGWHDGTIGWHDGTIRWHDGTIRWHNRQWLISKA